MLAKLFCNRSDRCCISEHAGLYRVGADVFHDRVDLRAYKLWTQLVDLSDSDGVLGGDRRERRGAVDANSGEGLEIRLDSGASARIRSRDRKCFAHGFHGCHFYQSLVADSTTKKARKQTAL